MSTNYERVIHGSSGRERVANGTVPGIVGTVRVVLRVVIGFLVAAIVAIAAVPLFVLRDLASGGSGWGLCPDGLDGCSTSYFAGFELLAWLAGALVAVAALLRVTVKLLRRVEHGYDRKRGAALVSPAPPPPEVSHRRETDQTGAARRL